MNDSPFQSSDDGGLEVESSSGGNREALRRVAKYQRWVIFALLANFVVNIVAFSTTEQGSAVYHRSTRRADRQME